MVDGIIASVQDSLNAGEEISFQTPFSNVQLKSMVQADLTDEIPENDDDKRARRRVLMDSYCLSFPEEHRRLLLSVKNK